MNGVELSRFLNENLLMVIAFELVLSIFVLSVFSLVFDCFLALVESTSRLATQGESTGKSSRGCCFARDDSGTEISES